MGSLASAFTSDQGFAGVLSSLTNQLATHLGSIDQTLEEAMKNQSAGNSTTEESGAQNSTAQSSFIAVAAAKPAASPVEQKPAGGNDQS